MWSWSAVRAFVPAASRPGPPDLAAHGDDGVGEIEEGVDDGDVTLVAAGETVKGVLPGVGAFDVPTPTSLKGRLRPLVRNVSMEAAFAVCHGRPVSVRRPRRLQEPWRWSRQRRSGRGRGRRSGGPWNMAALAGDNPVGEVRVLRSLAWLAVHDASTDTDPDTVCGRARAPHEPGAGRRRGFARTRTASRTGADLAAVGRASGKRPL